MRFGCLLLLLGLSSWVRSAEPAPVDLLIDKLQPLSSFKAGFTQVTTDSRGRVTASDTGQILVSRPNRMRWHLDPPREQLLVSDGETLWFYDPDLEQVTVRKGFGSINRVPALLLAGEVSRLREDFRVEMAGEGGDRHFRLLPLTKDTEFREIRLQFLGGEVRQLALLDTLGQKIVVDFEALELNGVADPGAFSFKIPPGVDVLEDY